MTSGLLYFQTLLALFVGVHALPAPEIESRQAITTLSAAQIASFKPFTHYASTAYCKPAQTLNWSCGANCNANPGFTPIASGGDGASPVPKDFHRARHYFLRIARQIWPSDPANPRHIQHATKEDSPPTAGFAALAAGYLGRMYLRGEGVKQDPVLAKMWFERGADYSDKESHNGLGLIWRDGLVDGKTDMKKALAHFSAAASQELAEAHVQLGKYHWCKYLIFFLTFQTHHPPPYSYRYFPYLPETFIFPQLPAKRKWRQCILSKPSD